MLLILIKEVLRRRARHCCIGFLGGYEPVAKNSIEARKKEVLV